MAINDHAHNTESMQYFPQPSMPDYYSYTLTHNVEEGDHEDKRNEVNDHIITALWESLEEIDIKGKELFRKIFSQGEVEIPLGRLAREAIGDSRAKDLLEMINTKVGKKIKAYQKDEEFVVAERGASIDEELSEKLERFKVKTVNIGGGVVKEDQK